MKITLTFLFALSCAFSQTKHEPSFVREGNGVVYGNARFEILTPTMGRMEYAPSGRFTDRPTVVVTNRNFPACKFDVEENDGWLIVRTAAMTLKYRQGSGEFNADNLRLQWKAKSGVQSWHPGQPDSANLGGVSYSLDGVRGDNPSKFPPGLLSRNGYFILDDTKSPSWDKAGDWIQPRSNVESQDWYWIVYGDDYASALKEYSDLAGKIPMIPRYVLGTWITDLNYEYLEGSDLVKNYRYSAENVKHLVEQFRNDGIPLDVLVLDFAWHKYGWQGGYDWSPMFPDPAGFLQWAHGEGVKVSLNDHPGYAKEGVLSASDSHAQHVMGALDIKEPPKATYAIDLSKDWKFSTDPNDEGVRKKWFALDFNDSSWNMIQAGTVWEEQGNAGYDGYGWYRKTIRYPDVPAGTPVLLEFGGVDDEYDLYVNGAKIGHYGERGSSIWSSLTSTDVTSLLKRGADNLVVLRVNDWGGGGGISKLPVGLTDRLPFEGIRFNLAVKKQADVYMNVLHNPLIDEGVDFWWIDGGKGACDMEGLDGQMWTNKIFYDYTQAHTGKRAFIFSRYGGWGNHRYPGIFTGDTYSEWSVLADEVRYSAQAGNVLMPYVTHDIGGFLGQKIPFDLYVRWIQFGVFNPILRLHSAFENPKDGNLRMPWVYGEEGERLVRKYFSLRYQLLPYIYTYAREAFDAAMPLNRPLYLQYPELDEAYKHPDEYFFGKELLCAPIVDSTGERTVYLPPGEWYDYFTDKPESGGRTIQTKHTLEDFPLFVRSGSIIPGRQNLAYSDQKSLDSLQLDIYGAESSTFTLYEDDGVSLAYEKGASARTPISSRRSKGVFDIQIGPAKGKYTGQPNSRAYTILIHAIKKPRSVSVNGSFVPEQETGRQYWHWDENHGRAIVQVALTGIRKRVTIQIRRSDQ